MPVNKNIKATLFPSLNDSLTHIFLKPVSVNAILKEI